MNQAVALQSGYLGRFCKALTSGVLILAAAWSFGFVLNPTPPANADIDPNMAIRAIIGEAANQGEKGMLAVACAIRNRGTLKGVWGVKARHVDQQPRWVWRTAREAWERSAKVDIVNGADHWENVKRFGKPFWEDDMIKIDSIGDHVFYRKAR